MNKREIIKFSEVREGQFIEYNGEIIDKQMARDILEKGINYPMYVVSDDTIQSILHQVYDDHIKGEEKDVYSAPNNGALIIFD